MRDHPKSMILPHCWVCETKFVDSGGAAIRNDHHIIPCAYGGTDGPEVSLCDSHHALLHKVANLVAAQKDTFPLMKSVLDPEHKKKILWLAMQVANAKLETQNDPNKKAVTMVTLNRKHRDMVDKLKTVHPSLRGREAVLLAALECLYSRHFR